MALDPDTIPMMKGKFRIRKESFGYLLFVRGYNPITINEDGKKIIELIDGKRSLFEISTLLFHAQDMEAEASVMFIMERVSEFLEFAVGLGAVAFSKDGL